MSRRRFTSKEVMIQVSRILIDRDAHAEFIQMVEEYGDTLRATAFMDTLKARLKALPVSKDPGVDVTCPFCGEGDFDKIGLRHHLEIGGCAEFNSTPIL